MPLKLELANPADFSAIITQQFSAFYPYDLLHDVVHPGGPAAHDYVLGKYLKDAEKDIKKEFVWLKVVDEETGNVAAAAKWAFFRGEKEWETAKVDVPEGKEDEREWRQWLLDQFWGRRMERVRGGCALLDLLFTAPEYHRRGAGAMLVQWGIDRADELGLPAFLEASEPGIFLYKSKGFILDEELWLSNDRWPGKEKVHYAFMSRPAKVESESTTT